MAVLVQHVVLALAPRTFVFNMCKAVGSLMDNASGLSQEWCFGTVLDRQDPTVRLTVALKPQDLCPVCRGARLSIGCLSTRLFPRWREPLNGACEEGAWRERSLQHR
eukprot:3635223-Pyramimonas_sp.AAC.1